MKEATPTATSDKPGEEAEREKEREGEKEGERDGGNGERSQLRKGSVEPPAEV